MEPGGWDNVRAALTFEEEGEPQWKGSAAGREKRFDGALVIKTVN